MTGMSRFTGEKLDPNSDAHLVQSIGDILTTPIGTRVGRRNYGSILPNLVDQPDNPMNRIRCFAAAAGALMRWEPRVKIKRVQLDRGEPGQLTLRLKATLLDQPRSGTLDLVIPLRFA